ncbi:MAG TPA: dihydrodipicolinate synthase family protein [Anaerohalosphaeraceae bacterium]|nr:dihydrodipicolinate synthase family protein [Anaerohalosphaeraceae bacterium]HOL89499.1 dihydrodipicolinate synthase family protein [Anaerohalosphaeraceae bacterium]HPP57112.1 dihydrodipicolinate synthase family protein [Anaerohalosphaeraceae bacterium]
MNTGKQYGGLIVPMVTPFASGRIDREAVCRIIDHLTDGGAAGIFVLGTTGEAPSISPEQKKELVEITVRHTNGRARTYAGISDNCFENSVRAARTYFALGVDAVVAHLPWYYSLNDAEIQGYFQSLADEIDGPLMLYNIPKTTHMSIPIEGIERLSRHPHIVGIKDSADDPTRTEQMIKTFAHREDFCYVLGCAKWSAKAVLLGADGIVPSSANLVPHLYRDLFESARCGNQTAAFELQEQTNRISSLYQENRSLGQSLSALKMMMSLAGLCSPEMLKPLQTADAASKTELENRMMKISALKTLLEKKKGL